MMPWQPPWEWGIQREAPQGMTGSAAASGCIWSESGGPYDAMSRHIAH